MRRLDTVVGMRERSLLPFFFLALCNNGCAAFVSSGKGNAPYLLVPLGLAIAYFGEKNLKANNGGALGWSLRIIGIALFLLG